MLQLHGALGVHSPLGSSPHRSIMHRVWCGVVWCCATAPAQPTTCLHGAREGEGHRLIGIAAVPQPLAVINGCLPCNRHRQEDHGERDSTTHLPPPAPLPLLLHQAAELTHGRRRRRHAAGSCSSHRNGSGACLGDRYGWRRNKHVLRDRCERCCRVPACT